MKALILSILLLFSFYFHCFAQNKINQDSLEKKYLIEAHKAPEYKKAFVDVNEIRQNIVLAKKGLLKNADVIKDYNLRLGGYMGKKQNLKEVELRINDAGEKFIQFILLKAAARLATEDASEKSN